MRFQQLARDDDRAFDWRQLLADLVSCGADSLPADDFSRRANWQRRERWAADLLAGTNLSPVSGPRQWHLQIPADFRQRHVRNSIPSRDGPDSFLPDLVVEHGAPIRDRFLRHFVLPF
jgi:hypothetical protein